MTGLAPGTVHLHEFTDSARGLQQRNGLGSHLDSARSRTPAEPPVMLPVASVSCGSAALSKVIGFVTAQVDIKTDWHAKLTKSLQTLDRNLNASLIDNFEKAKKDVPSRSHATTNVNC